MGRLSKRKAQPKKANSLGINKSTTGIVPSADAPINETGISLLDIGDELLTVILSKCLYQAAITNECSLS